MIPLVATPHMSKRQRILLAIAVLAIGGSATAWTLWPDAEDEASFEDQDTGLTRDQTEDMMRSIGYVQ
jgi:hypothetical protein